MFPESVASDLILFVVIWGKLIMLETNFCGKHHMTLLADDFSRLLLRSFKSCFDPLSIQACRRVMSITSFKLVNPAQICNSAHPTKLAPSIWHHNTNLYEQLQAVPGPRPLLQDQRYKHRARSVRHQGNVRIHREFPSHGVRKSTRALLVKLVLRDRWWI